MRCMFRADASLRLGIGHVMRCLTLARRIQRKGGQVLFVSRALPGHLGEFLTEQGIDVHLLEAESGDELDVNELHDAQQSAAIAQKWGAERIVVDHYGLSAKWEGAQSVPVMALDDAPNRPHQVGLLLDQNYSADCDAYASLLPQGAVILSGTEFALLREEFSTLRPRSLEARAERSSVREVLVTMGGTDFPDATGWVLHWLAQSDLTQNMRFTVVMGPTAPHLDKVRKLAAELPRTIQILAGSDQMAMLMHNADLAIGAAGSTAWERCAMGLPTITLVLAENQRPIAKALDTEGAAATVNFGDEQALVTAFERLSGSPDALSAMSSHAARLCDGGGAERVLLELEAYDG